VQIIVGIIGGIALTFLGGYMLRMRPVIALEEYEGGKIYSPIIGGFITSALSPCFIIWWAVIGPALILKSTVFGLFTIPALLLTHWSIDLGWYCIVSFYVGKKRKALSIKSYRILMVICGLVIIAFGIYFLINSLTLILTPA
jgi:threonine/homoserine/homoserine lactone efflux protein